MTVKKVCYKIGHLQIGTNEFIPICAISNNRLDFAHQGLKERVPAGARSNHKVNFAHQGLENDCVSAQTVKSKKKYSECSELPSKR